jgi:hypothetical protein
LSFIARTVSAIAALRTFAEWQDYACIAKG